MISLEDIHAAQERIRDGIRETPVPNSETLSRESGNELYLKLENLHVTGSFKERGALNRILTMTDEERARGVIAASAGNHAQAIAYHAGRLGIRAQICMPVFTPLVKVAATRDWGAEVILHGENFDEANQEWTVTVRREGKPVVLRPKQLVFALGVSGFPNVPQIAGAETFKGQQHHSSQHPGGDAWRGKKAVVLGSNNSAHDICADL